MKFLSFILFLNLFTFAHKAVSNNNWAVSDLKNDEALVFFNTSAWFNTNTKQWHVPIHGWVYEPEQSLIRKNFISKIFNVILNLEPTAETQKNFNQRANLFLADNERGKSIVIRFANRTYELTPSHPNGHFETTLLVDQQIISHLKQSNALLRYQAVLDADDNRKFSGQVNLWSPVGLSVISDIDDTIKISQVNDHKQLLNHTFYLDFKAVPGMAEKYQQWLKPNGALHFVSSSPWQLYPELLLFIEQAQFPEADYALKAFRFKDQSLFNLFAESSETKPPQIIEILEKYPHRKFILIGDSGELDPEIYADIQQQYPEQIIKILIRNVSNETVNNHRFQSIFKGTDTELWQLFNTPDEINLDDNKTTTAIKLAD